MQLKNKKPVRLALTAATCALLAEQPLQAAESGDWVLNLGTLLYDEKDRVSIVEPIAIITRYFNEEDYVSLRVVHDTMSGASPSGASVSAQQQSIPAHTTTSASAATAGVDTVVPANTLPVNDFSDQRTSVGIDWQKAFTRTFRSILGANFSAENDYSSLGGNLSLQKDTEDKLTTFTLGLALSFDTVQPPGGKPAGLSVLTRNKGISRREIEDDDENEGEDGEGNGQSLFSGETKLLTDAMFGITQVIHRRILTQVNYSIGQSNGYLTDPYKIISRVDRNTGNTIDYFSEKRPDSRLRQSVFWKTVIHLPSDVVHLSYRYYWDDWSVESHTIDVKYRFNLGEHFYLRPNFRYYKQTGARFFHYSLLNGQPLPEYASADLRLAPMQSTTTGLKLGYNFTRNTEIGLRVEQMQQWGEKHPSEAVGSQRDVELFPKLEVMMYTLELSLDF